MALGYTVTHFSEKCVKVGERGVSGGWRFVANCGQLRTIPANCGQLQTNLFIDFHWYTFVGKFNGYVKSKRRRQKRKPNQ